MRDIYVQRTWQGVTMHLSVDDARKLLDVLTSGLNSCVPDPVFISALTKAVNDKVANAADAVRQIAYEFTGWERTRLGRIADLMSAGDLRAASRIIHNMDSAVQNKIPEAAKPFLGL